MEVAERIVKLTAGVAPKCTAVVPSNTTPVRLTVVDLFAGPHVGLIRVIAGTTYVTRSTGTTGLVLDVVTVTSAVPAARGGTVAVMLLLETTVKDDAGAAPMWTAVTPVKPVPVMVMTPPPPVDTVAGVTCVT
jgi:hypothetical protein